MFSGCVTKCSVRPRGRSENPARPICIRYSPKLVVAVKQRRIDPARPKAPAHSAPRSPKQDPPPEKAGSPECSGSMTNRSRQLPCVMSNKAWRCAALAAASSAGDSSLAQVVNEVLRLARHAVTPYRVTCMVATLSLLMKPARKPQICNTWQLATARRGHAARQIGNGTQRTDSERNAELARTCVAGEIRHERYLLCTTAIEPLPDSNRGGGRKAATSRLVRLYFGMPIPVIAVSTTGGSIARLAIPLCEKLGPAWLAPERCPNCSHDTTLRPPNPLPAASIGSGNNWGATLARARRCEGTTPARGAAMTRPGFKKACAAAQIPVAYR